MADRLSPDARSKLMSKVRGKNTGPEIRLRSALHHCGFRFRLHDRSLPGTPDIVMRARRTVVLVHGCFWHGHTGCRRAKLPETRAAFWAEKIKRNTERDHAVCKALKMQGFRVVVFWQCELRKDEEVQALIRVRLGDAKHAEEVATG
jgi:DNA mismatch endonuclease (patch repair protein)